MHTDNIISIPQAYAAYLTHTNPESFVHSRWSETCDLLLGHIRQIVHKSDFDCQRLADALDALAVRTGIYQENDAARLVGSWMGTLDTAEHKPFVTQNFDPEDPNKLYIPFGYWLYRSEKTPVRTMILGWGEATDVLLALIRIRVQAASTVHQGFEDLVTWLDDLALNKGFEVATPAVSSAIRKMFGFDPFDMREALAIAA